MWRPATNDLLVDGAKVRNRGGFKPRPGGGAGWMLGPYAEGEVVGRQRGKLMVNFGVEYGALWEYSIKQKEYEELEVWHVG